MLQVIELPIKHPELFESLGVAQPKVWMLPEEAPAATSLFGYPLLALTAICLCYALQDALQNSTSLLIHMPGAYIYDAFLDRFTPSRLHMSGSDALSICTTVSRMLHALAAMLCCMFLKRKTRPCWARRLRMAQTALSPSHFLDFFCFVCTSFWDAASRMGS